MKYTVYSTVWVSLILPRSQTAMHCPSSKFSEVWVIIYSSSLWLHVCVCVCVGGGGEGIVSPVSPCSTVRGREVQPLAALYPTVRLSPWRQVRKNIHSRVWISGPTWSVLHSEGHPSWFPLVPNDWGIWASPPETDQDSWLLSRSPDP